MAANPASRRRPLPPSLTNLLLLAALPLAFSLLLRRRKSCCRS